MASDLLIQEGVGIGPFTLGQTFREVINATKEFVVIKETSSIEYSDLQPFHQHLIVRSVLSIQDFQYELLLAFEPYMQILHFIKLSLQKNELDLSLGYHKESDEMKLGVKNREGFRSLDNLSQFLREFTKKRYRILDVIEKRSKILETYDDNLMEKSTKFVFKCVNIEEECEEFRSVSSIQIPNDSTTSDISRIDTTEYKLKSIVILSDTYTTNSDIEPMRNFTPIAPIYTYNSLHDYLHITIANRTFMINCTSTSQQILTMIGTPNSEYYTRSHRKIPAYFYNYKDLGLDVMFNCNTHKVSMLVLHNNLPGHAHFNEYNRAFFTITHLINEDEYIDISYYTNWQSLSMETRILGELPSVGVSRHGNANSFYPFPPTALVNLSKHCLLEIHDNGYISNVFISTNFSHPKLLDEYKHRRLNLLKHTQLPENILTSPEHQSLTINPFVDENPTLFDTDFSAKSNKIKYPYQNLPEFEDDFALYSYNPFIEPQPIPFKLQKMHQTNRTDYILKRIEASGKTAQVKNRVKFDDIPYIPSCMQTNIVKKNLKDDLMKVGTNNLEHDVIKMNGEVPVEVFSIESDIPNENEVILDSETSNFLNPLENSIGVQSNGFLSRRSPTLSEVTEITPFSTVTTDSRMYSVRSSLFTSTHDQLPNGHDIANISNLDPNLSLQSNVSRKSAKFDLDSQPTDFKELVENATQDEIDFPKLMKNHNRISPILSKRLEIYSQILPFWRSGKSQQALEVIANQENPLPESDPQLYSHLIHLFLTKEYNWTIKTSQTLLDSLLNWISINSADYQLETTALVIRLIIKRFRVRLIGNEPTNKALKEQFATFLQTLFHTFTRLESVISHPESKNISETVLKMISESHHELRLFKSKFPVS